MRRLPVLIIGALTAGAAVTVIADLPASAVSSVTLGASTCGINGPDVTLKGTWNPVTSTCTVTGMANVQVGSTLTVPTGTTLSDTSATFPFGNNGSVVNDGTVDACYWNDVGKGLTTNATTGTFTVGVFGSCHASEHEVYVGGQFQNYGVYANTGTLVVDGYLGGAQFTSYCGSTYSATGTVVVILGGVLVNPSGCPQTISFTGPATAPFGSSYVPAATASSGLPVAFSLDASSTGCALAAGTVTFTGTGTCVVDADQPGNATYAAALTVPVSTVVSEVPQAISFSGPATATIGGSYAPAATASSGLPVAFSLDASSTGCALAAGTVTFTGAGACVVDADQPGNATYAAALTVPVSTVVSAPVQAAQTITFGPLPDVLWNSAPFTVSASASSGLAVSFASLTPGVCQVAGSTVTTATMGQCTVEATQDGDTHWLPAPAVDQSFNVAAGVDLILPRDFRTEHGSKLFVAFALVDANNVAIPDAISQGASMAVSFNGGPPVAAFYAVEWHKFLAEVDTPRDLAPGSYPLTVISNTPSVPIEATTAQVKISRRPTRDSPWKMLGLN